MRSSGIFLELPLHKGYEWYGPELVTSNRNFASWAGTAFPDDLPTGYSGYGTATSARYRENATNACRLVCDGGAMIGLSRANILTAGKTYRLQVNVLSGTGTLGFYLGNGNVAFTNPSGITQYTRRCDGSNALLAAQLSVATDLTFTDFSVREFGLVDLSRAGRRVSPRVYPTWTALPSGLACWDADGTSSLIDVGSDPIGTGDITIEVPIIPDGLGAGSAGRLLSNGSFEVWLSGTNAISVTSDGGSTVAVSANNAWTAGVPAFISVSRSTAGTVNIGVNGVVSGTVNQPSGTPVAGTTNLFVGNRSAGDRALDARMALLRGYQYIRPIGASASRWNSIKHLFSVV